MKNYQNCTICEKIPDKTTAFWKSNELQSDPLPSSEKSLKIFGAPFFNDHRTHSHSCLKRCPECGTYYLWEMEYEYLVNGSEDEITLTRLSESEAQEQIKSYTQIIEDTKEKFKEWSIPHLENLRLCSDRDKISHAATHFSYYQLKGLDISLAIPDLIRTLAYHLHTKEEYCVGSSIYLLLSDYVAKNKENKQKVLDLLNELDPKACAPEVEELITSLEKKKKTH